MNINILTNGTRGDIQPLIYLAQELIKSGDIVTMTAGENFRELIKASGVGYTSMPVNLQDYMNSSEGKDMIARISGNPFSYMKEMKKLMIRFSRDTLNAYWEACRDTDLIITTTGALGDILIAEKLSVPLVEVQLQPLYPSDLYTYPLIPFSLPLPAFRRLSYYIMEAMLNSVFSKELKRWQKDIFGSVRKYRGGIFAERRRSADLIVGAYSTHLIKRPDDWPDRIATTGFFRQEEKGDSTKKLDNEITEFLEKGAKPFYIGFGSASISRPEKLFKTLETLLNESEIRLVFSAPWEELDCPVEQDRLLCIKEAPHDLLFREMAGVIHHGGAGTVSAAIHAGVPQTLYPLNADQPFWGRRLYEIGLIPKPFGLKRINCTNLSAAISFMSESELIKRNSLFCELVKGEKGVSEAAGLISKIRK